jgi:hypothetical protein
MHAMCLCCLSHHSPCQIRATARCTYSLRVFSAYGFLLYGPYPMLPSKSSISTVSAPTHSDTCCLIWSPPPSRQLLSLGACTHCKTSQAENHQMSHHSPPRRLFVSGFGTAENIICLDLVPCSPLPPITATVPFPYPHPLLSSHDDGK